MAVGHRCLITGERSGMRWKWPWRWAISRAVTLGWLNSEGSVVVVRRVSGWLV
jgi:hypothetical protein